MNDLSIYQKRCEIKIPVMSKVSFVMGENAKIQLVINENKDMIFPNHVQKMLAFFPQALWVCGNPRISFLL